MSLTTRLTAFFLVALLVVLAGFSAALFLLARAYLHGELDARLEAALDVLSAAAEIEKDRVEWSPEKDGLTLGRGTRDGEPRWAVHAPDGKVVDCSASAREGGFPAGWMPGGNASRATGREDVGGWRVAWRRLTPRRPPPGDELDEDEFPALVLTAGLPLAPVQADLRRLALTTAGLSAALWLLAAAAGRLLSRRALAPLTRMADAAARMNADEPGSRLPPPRTGDELDGLCAAFNGLLGRLQESFERQRRFTAEASHQLRTPLAALIGQVEVARRRERSAEEYRRVLDAAHEEGVRLRQIVESLLFLARQDAESLRPAFEEIDLAAWLPAQAARWTRGERGGDLRMDVAPGGLPVRAHAPLLAQLLDGLVENATKYSDPDTPVTVRAWRQDGEIRVAVEDRGWGLSGEELSRVFEPFFRSDGARRSGRPGVGLGLAVARRIASALGGELTAESERGRGSRFTLRLPAAGPVVREMAEGRAETGGTTRGRTAG